MSCTIMNMNMMMTMSRMINGGQIFIVDIFKNVNDKDLTPP